MFGSRRASRPRNSRRPYRASTERSRRSGRRGVTSNEPLVTVTRDGRTAFYADPPILDHEPGTTTLPTPALGGLAVGQRRVLGGAGWRRPADPDDHRAAGWFVDAAPEAVLAVAEDLRGRGWGDRQRDAPIAEAWQTAAGADGDAAVVVNGHGSAADSLLLSSVPFEVLEGAQAAASAVAADHRPSGASGP